MKLSLKARVILLLAVLTLLPIAFFVYHSLAMKEKVLEDRLRFHRLYASSVVNKVELFLERVMSDTESLVYLYRNLGFSEEEIIWRITGQVRGVFEGAFYSPDGMLLYFASRESSEPKFDKFVNVKKVSEFTGINYTQYKEPFLRFAVREVEGGLLKGVFLFSLDLSLFWQSIVSTRPGPHVEVFLTDGRGNILAYSDMRFSERSRVDLRQGTYRSQITGVEVLGVGVRGEDWGVVVEEPLKVVLEPLYSFQRKALLTGSILTLSSGLFAILILLRIFRPLEYLRSYVVSWEKENLKKTIEGGDEVSELSQAFQNLIKKLEEEKRLYLTLFENTLDGIIVFNSERRIIDVNRIVLQQFKLSREELIGKRMEELIGEELPMTSLFFSEKRVRLKGEVFCQLRQDIMRIEGNLYILWRLRDVSQEKELRFLLQQTAKLSLAGEIACCVAHQINNPLASIMGYAESIILSSQDEEVRRRAEIIMRNARKCAETVSKLLNVGKPFEGKPDYVKPEELTIDAINILSPKAKRKSVRIEFESTLNGRRIFTFPWQVEQVLINVLDNAIDASPPNSSVRIRLEEKSGSVLWKIKDTGEGIPREELENIFKPFYTTKEYGTGLGLPLARRLMRNIGGDLKVLSEKGKGTEVQIIFNRREHEGSDS